MANCLQQLGTKRKAGASESLEATKISFPAIQTFNTSCAPIVVQGYLPESGHGVKRLHMDNDSSVDIMYEHCFRQLPTPTRRTIKPPTTTLSGFLGESAWPIGILDLRLELRDSKGKDRGSLTHETKEKLRNILISNLDVFCWRDADMTGVPREIAQHYLRASINLTPIKQKKRPMAPERSEWLRREVDKLVKANILRKLNYQTWVANPVLVAKSDGTWRLCIDSNAINKACPKDNYPLPEIDWKVKSLAGFRFKCFMDAYKGYHQIQMAEEDEEKTAFHTDQGIYCYTKMPFGLKNAGATNQRTIDTTFAKQIGHKLEAYVNDLVIKSNTVKKLLTDILETFNTLRSINMKLKPAKCSFGEEVGNFLGHIVTPRGIKANSKKIEAIEKMPSPKTKKQVQSLNGKLASLTRFLSKAAERSLPFFHTLKDCTKKSNFKWTDEAEKVFQDIKALLKNLPTLTAPIAGKTLMTLQYLRKLLVLSLLPNGEMLKCPYTSSARCYQELLYKPEISGRLTKWAIELGEHEIAYCARSAIKGQVMADYLAQTAADMPAICILEKLPAPSLELWELYTDGAACSEGAGAGLILTGPRQEEHTYALRFNFKVANNEAEYEALLVGMRIARELGIIKLQAYVDSQLVANQINGTFDTNDQSMQSYLALVHSLADTFTDFRISQIPRSQNKQADVFKKSTEPEITVASVEEEEATWMMDIIEFLRIGSLPNNEKEAMKIRVKAPNYELRGDVLYRKSYLGASLRCVGPKEAATIIDKIHKGSCGLHYGSRTVTERIK
ncbi:uncharacterized protein [Rutidosis leptorrhynchoides]|uniref:uncharacterized protein n=1 Tax=Rutidosis leptorrhynchoides TaxID=125765 RepID=UPI003A98CF4F